MNKAAAIDNQVVLGAQTPADKTAVIRGVLPKAIVEAIVVPYRPINVPFRSTVYQALSAERRDIRLLEVTNSDPTRCNLIAISLNDKLQYAALSDEGDQLATSSLDERSKCTAFSDGGTNPGNIGYLELNGHPFTIKGGVGSAIRQFCTATRGSEYGWSRKAFRLWVAALCVNQANPSERDSQAQLMREIYANAKVVWACSGNTKNATLVTGVDYKDVTPASLKMEPSKPTQLATEVSSVLRAHSTLKDARATVYKMPNLTEASRNLLSFGSEKFSTPPQPTKVNHSVQLCKLGNHLDQDTHLDGVYSTKTLKTSLEDIEWAAKHRNPSRASLQNWITPTADSIKPFGDESIHLPPPPASLPNASNLLYGIEAVQRAEKVKPFEYRPIKTDREIRLLQIDKHPAGFLGIFKCSLIHAQLGHLSYPYNAVSYTWGDPTPTRSLIVDCDQSLRVTENVGFLVDFLFKGMNSGTSFFWVDALCVNQVDLEEKSSQVSLMRDIYQHASQVIIWLGMPIGSYEEDAIEDLQRWERFFKLYDENKDIYGVILSNRANKNAQSISGSSGTVWMKEVAPDGRVRMRRPSITDMSQRHMTPAMVEARFRLHYGKKLPTDWNWGHISLLLSKPWFERVWVIQEAFAGSKVLVHCGTKVMPWEEFNFVTSRLMRYGLDASVHHGTGESDQTAIKTIPTGLRSSVFIHALKIVKAEKKTLRLAPLLLITSRYQATNPRDKVYALLGISSEGGHSDLAPNYSLSVKEVFIKTTVHLILEDDSLEMLAAAGIGWHRETPELPSWVPDFKCLPELPNWRFELYRDSPAASPNENKTTSTAKFIPNINSLIVSGCLIDDVTWVGPLPCPHPQTAKSVGAASYLHDFSIDSQEWFFQTKFKCRCLIKYPTDEPLEEVYWRTLIMNSTHQGFPAIAEYGNSFSRHEFRLGEAAQYREVYKKERVDLAILMDELAHHEKQDDVSAELAYMQRMHQSSNLELERRWIQAYTTNGAGRNAFVTRRGYFGIAAPGIAKGDQVALFLGLVTPMILRSAKSWWQRAASKSTPAYHLVSESYIHGLMPSEGLSDGKMRDICLC
jgi:hypothetical protein